jgi:hypothetical protein
MSRKFHSKGTPGGVRPSSVVSVACTDFADIKTMIAMRKLIDNSVVETEKEAALSKEAREDMAKHFMYIEHQERRSA